LKKNYKLNFQTNQILRSEIVKNKFKKSDEKKETMSNWLTCQAHNPSHETMITSYKGKRKKIIKHNPQLTLY
jgi:hypothetical protein